MKDTSKAHLFTIGATVLVASSFPVGASITHEMNSLVITLLRFAVAALLFGPFVYLRYGLTLPSRKQAFHYALISGSLVLFFWGMFSALRYTSALNTASIFTLMPLFASFFSWALLKERLTSRARVALFAGLIGALWVVFRGDFTAIGVFGFNKGDMIFLGGTIAVALYGALVKYFHRGEPMAIMTFWTLVFGFMWLLILSLPTLITTKWYEAPSEVYVGILYLAIFTTLITFFTYQWSTAVIGPTKVMSYSYLNPGLVIIMEIIMGQGIPSVMTWPGLVIIMFATLIFQRTPTHSKAGTGIRTHMPRSAITS